MGIKVSIVGATGNVGREFLSIIEERKFPVEELFLLASSKSEGKKLSFGKKKISVLDLNKFDFKRINFEIILIFFFNFVFFVILK